MHVIKTKESKIFIGNDVLDEVKKTLEKYKDHQKILIVDENSFNYCATDFLIQTELANDVEIIELDSGEENKTLEICQYIWQTFVELKIDRNALVINLGGGVICDLGGFVASIYKRGINFINVPTTLLSQIDASVGGKVGVDLNNLKNILGVFNEAEAVFIYPNFLRTLNKREMLAGYSEALKHALIADVDYWKRLKTNLLSNDLLWEQLILKSVEIKNDIVKRDLKESGERKKLNFGHTIGHALESYSLSNEELPLLHGEAVAVGLVCEAYISHKVNGLNHKEFKDIVSAVTSFFSYYDLKEDSFQLLIGLMKNDKKNKNRAINFTLLKAIGEATVDHKVGEDLILEALNYYCSLKKVD